MKQATVGHPVDVVTGSVFTAWTDFHFKGRTEFAWRRFYSTGNPEQSAQGRGWTSRHFVRVEQRGSKMILIGDEGHAHAFERPGGKEPSEIAMHPWALYEENGGMRLYDRRLKKTLHFTASTTQEGIYLLRKIEDLNGLALHLAYGVGEQLVGLEQPCLQRRFRIAYNGIGTIESIELDVAGHSPSTLVSFGYDQHANLVRAVDPEGGAITYAYDEQHRLIAERNQLGGTFHFEYDAEGRCVHTWGDGGYLERWLSYDRQRGSTAVVDGTGAATRFDFGPDGRITKKVDALGNERKFFHSLGVEQSVASDGTLRESEVDIRGDLVRKTDELGRSFMFKYDDRAQITAIADPGGAIWERRYDDRGQLISLLGPDGNAWLLERGASGEIVKQTDPEGRSILRRYDPLMRWQEVSDENGYYRCEYDIFGRQVVAANADGVIMSWAYDRAGRVLRTKTGDGATADFTYDAAGNLVGHRDESGAEWAYRYDTFNHLVALRDPLGHEVQIAYDVEGRRVCVTNQRGETHEDTLDAVGQVVERKYFDGSRTNYRWDARGRLVEVLKANGDRIELAHDAVGNVIRQKSYRTASTHAENAAVPLTTELSYDWRGSMVGARNVDSDISFSYDASGRTIEEWQNGIGVAYTYDRAGKLSGRKVQGGSSGGIRFHYDAVGALSSVEDGAGVVETYRYERNCLIRRRSLRGGAQEVVHGRTHGPMKAQRVDTGFSELVSREYQYDQRRNLVALVDSKRGAVSFRYDGALRLTDAEKLGGRRHAFVYEPGGDLRDDDGKAREYGPGSRLLRGPDVTYRYDASGQQIERRQERVVIQQEYDAQGRLVLIRSNGEVVARYFYDALNRRLAKTDAQGRTTRFIWSGRHLAAVIPQGGQPQELLISKKEATPVLAWPEGAAAHYICDQIGTPREVVGNGGRIVWQSNYLPSGEAKVQGEMVSELFNLRLPGQFFDAESGLHYNFNRYYDPKQARYLTQDPAGIDAGLNLYDYPRDPVNWTDPFGLSCPNPVLVEENSQQGWQIHQHDDGSLTITADCTRGFATPKPGGLRPTIHAGDDNRYNPPEAHLGQDGRLIVMEGTHRSVAASRGQQMPVDPDNPHLGGVPGRPGYMTYEYSPQYNDDQPGVPLQSLDYPPGYPHTL